MHIINACGISSEFKLKCMCFAYVYFKSSRYDKTNHKQKHECVASK